MLVATGSLSNDSLSGRVAVVTGAGGGIGYEAGRSLLWLGGKVIIAEINPRTGEQAARRLSQEFGSAAAVAMASGYRGQEISSIQALTDAGITVPVSDRKTELSPLTPEQSERALALCRDVHATLAKESASWKERSVFERQWLMRTFRQKASLSVDEWLRALDQLQGALEPQTPASVMPSVALDRLAAYYAHLHEMAKGYAKDPAERDEQLRIVKGWQAAVEELDALLR
jgi:hypothetical protein